MILKSCRLAVKVQLPFLISIVRTDDVQKRRFAAAALALYRYELVIIERQVDPADTHRENVVGIIYFADIF